MIEQAKLIDALFSRRSAKPSRHAQLELARVERSTMPEAPMTLFMRIQTRNGPHTVVASGISLTAASHISEAMEMAGHHVEFVDQGMTSRPLCQHINALRQN